MNLDTKKFYGILKKVSLGGLIPSCTLRIENGIGKINGLDAMSTVFAQSVGRICDDKNLNESLSLKDIGKLVKFVGDIKEREESVEFEIKENRFCILSRTKGAVKFLLGEVEKEDKTKTGIEQVINSVKLSKELSQDKINEVLYFVGLFGQVELILRIKNEKMFVCSPDNDYQTFSVFLGKEKQKDLELRFNGQHFKSVMSEINWKSKNAPFMCYEKDSPIVIKQEENIWILALIV